MIRITIKGSEATLKKLKSLPQRLTLALLKAMQQSAIAIQSKAKENAPVFRGLLRVSILQSVGQEGNRLVGHVGSALPYASVVEFGRATGWRPPASELRSWAAKRLGDARLAFAVAQAIKRRGFKAQPYLLPALQENLPRVQGYFQARLAEVLQAEGGNA